MLRCCYSIAISLYFLLSVLTFARSITIATGEWPPFTDSSAQNKGLALTIINEALQFSDLNPVFDFISWSKAYSLTLEGQYDASAVWSYQDDRNHYFYYSEAVLEHPIVFFHLKRSSFHWSHLEDLQGMVIGATAGQAYGGGFEAFERSKVLSVVRFNSNIKSLKNLHEGNIDLFPSDINIGYFLIDKNFNSIQKEQFTHNATMINASPTYLIAPKSVPGTIAFDLIQAFNNGLAQLKANGRYQKLLNHAIHQPLRSGSVDIKR